MAAAEVLAALTTLYTAATPTARREADAFLDAFQKSREAWDAAFAMLESPATPAEGRTFAAQTIKLKCIYDLDTYPDVQTLRARVLHLFSALHAERTVYTHLAVALSSLVIQTEWADPFSDVMSGLAPAGDSEAARRALAEFLRVLPEEGRRDRYRGANARWKERAPKVLEWAAAGLNGAPSNSRVLDAFAVLTSWLSDGDLPPAALLHTPIIPLLFNSLAVPELADTAADLAVDLIGATRNIQANMEVIQNLYPNILGLKPMLDQALAEEDEETTRSLCRIFAEAGESYVDLIASHPNDFSALVQCLLQSACSGVDLSKFTFRFWWELADKLAGRKAGAAEAPAREAFKPTFRALAEGLLKHLHFPPDSEPMTAQERDDFRELRHDMGDVLKDCAQVLGPEDILSIPYRVLAAAEGARSWQELEAPLFFLRAVGARIPDDENAVLPQVMSLLPNISPSHPKLRYAALLVIGRYASWTAKHADFIPFQLTFVADGFLQGDAECKPAATQAFLFLCESCGGSLVPYLPQLHPFYVATLPTLQTEDRKRMAEAVSNVLLNATDNLSQWLGEFLLPVAQRLHALAGEPGAAEDDAKVNDVADLVAQLAAFVKHLKLRNLPDGAQHPLVDIISQMYPILSSLMSTMGHLRPVASAIARLFVNCVTYLKGLFLGLLPQILAQLVETFERTEDPAYLWVCKTCVEEYGEDQTEAGRSMAGLFRTVSNVAFGIISKRGLNEVPELVEEYFATVTVFFRRTPQLIAHQPADFVQSLVACSIHCIATEQPESAEMVLAAVKDVYLASLDAALPLGATKEVLRGNAEAVLKALLNAVLFSAPREMVRDCGDAAKAIVDAFPGEAPAWLGGLVRQIPDEGEDKEAFLGKLEAACLEPSSSKLMRNAMQDYASAYRRRHLTKSRSGLR